MPARDEAVGERFHAAVWRAPRAPLVYSLGVVLGLVGAYHSLANERPWLSALLVVLIAVLVACGAVELFGRREPPSKPVRTRFAPWVGRLTALAIGLLLAKVLY